MTANSAQRPVIIFSTADWRTRYWTNKQHNAATLARRGHRVLYVETVGLRRARLFDRRDVRRLLRRLLGGLRSLVFGPTQEQPGLWVLSPLTLPWAQGNTLVRRVNAWMLRLALRRAITRVGLRGAEVWTYHPYVLDAIGGLQLGPLSYHNVDDLSAVPGVDTNAFLAAETALLECSDTVFVTARRLEVRCQEHNANVHFLANVADADHFGRAIDAVEAADLAGIPRPRLGYHGVLSDLKLDLPLLAELLRRHPEWHLVLIGDAPEGQDPASLAALRDLGNVHFLGPRPYADLPAYLAGFDVGLIPLARNAYTASMYPMKLFEFLAAGVPVVASDAPFVKDAPGSIEVATDVESFSAAIARQLTRGRLSHAQAREAVGDHTWDSRLTTMLAITARV
jgi:glycosyltransferase involved in cell wall biosynthesis